MNAKRFNITDSFSAISTFRFYRHSIGSKQAYWLALARYGWKGIDLFAYSKLNRLAKDVIRRA